MSGAGSRSSPLKSSRAKTPSSSASEGSLISQVPNAFIVEIYVSRWNMNTYIIGTAQARCILESMNGPTELGRRHTQALGSGTGIGRQVAHIRYTRIGRCGNPIVCGSRRCPNTLQTWATQSERQGRSRPAGGRQRDTLTVRIAIGPSERHCSVFDRSTRRAHGACKMRHNRRDALVWALSQAELGERGRHDCIRARRSSIPVRQEGERNPYGIGELRQVRRRVPVEPDDARNVDIIHVRSPNRRAGPGRRCSWVCPGETSPRPVEMARQSLCHEPSEPHSVQDDVATVGSARRCAVRI